jgi:C4-dicarboxylate transporter
MCLSARPIFTNDNSLTQFGEFGKNVDINVYVYSIPIYKTKQWYRGNTPVSTSTKYVVSESLAIVNDTFHCKNVQLDGYSVMLTINNLKESDFNVSYRLQLSYGVIQTVQYTVLLESASKYKQRKTTTNDKEEQNTKTILYLVIQMVRILPLIHNLEFYIFWQINSEIKLKQKKPIDTLVVTTHF